MQCAVDVRDLRGGMLFIGLGEAVLSQSFEARVVKLKLYVAAGITGLAVIKHFGQYANEGHGARQQELFK